MGEVERQPTLGKWSGESRFAVWTILKFQFIRCAIEMRRKKRAKDSAGRDETTTMRFKPEASCPFLFIARESRRKPNQRRRREIEVCNPYMNIARAKRQVIGRKRPKD